MRFLDRMRGTLMAAPSSELPVRKMPLRSTVRYRSVDRRRSTRCSHHAAPSTEKPSAKVVPKKERKTGSMVLNWFDHVSPIIGLVTPE